METENVGTSAKNKAPKKAKGGKGKKGKKRRSGKAVSIYRGKDIVSVASANVGGWKGAAALAGAGGLALGAWYFGSSVISNNYARGLALAGLSLPFFFVKSRPIANAGAAITAVALVTSSLTFFRNVWPVEGEEEAPKAKEA